MDNSRKRTYGGQSGTYNGDQKPHSQILQKQAEKCERIGNRPEVNFNVLPGEVILYCPYYPNHFFRDSRAHYHLTDCRKQYIKEMTNLGKPVEINICPHVYKHHIPLKEWDEHLKECNRIAERELKSIGEVLPSDMEPSGPISGPYQYTVPGTAEVINRRGGYAKTTGDYAWEDMNWDSGKKMKDEEKKNTEPKSESQDGATETEGEETTPSIGRPMEQPKEVIPQTKATFSYMDQLRKMKNEVQPIGLTKSEKQQWQRENLARVKKNIEEKSAREFFEAHHPGILEREKFVPRDSNYRGGF